MLRRFRSVGRKRLLHSERHTVSNVWSVRGVPPELRREIVEAAQRAGLPVAEWLDRVLSPTLREPPPDLDELLSRIDECLAAIDRLDAGGRGAVRRG